MLRNMEMLAITNPGMLDALEQAKVIYSLSGSPVFFDEGEKLFEDCNNYCDAPSEIDEYDWRSLEGR